MIALGLGYSVVTVVPALVVGRAAEMKEMLMRDALSRSEVRTVRSGRVSLGDRAIARPS